MSITRYAVVVSLAIAFLSPTAPVNADTQWGPYTVRTNIGTHNDPTGHQSSVKILTGDGKLVRAIDGRGTVKAVVIKAAIHGKSVLLTSIGTGGNNGIDLIYAFIQTKHGIRNVVAIAGILDHVNLRDIDHDGTSELILRDVAAFNTFDHFSRNGVGEVDSVYRWNGRRYVDATSRFPENALARAKTAQIQFQRSLPAVRTYLAGPYVDGHGDSEGQSREDIMAPLVVYWANETVAGRQRTAERWIASNTAKSVRYWFASHKRILSTALSMRKRRLPTDNRKILGYG